MSIVSLDQAKAQLRIDDTYSDTELTGMVDAASDIVAGYLGWGDPPPYDGSTTPYPSRIQTATLLVLASLYEDREGANDPIGPGVVSILRRDRDPALA
jgi:hypothetical protein